jgi:hypothetical protein
MERLDAYFEEKKLTHKPEVKITSPTKVLESPETELDNSARIQRLLHQIGTLRAKVPSPLFHSDD